MIHTEDNHIETRWLQKVMKGCRDKYVYIKRIYLINWADPCRGSTLRNFQVEA